jgi:hypothetical protein
MNSGIPPVLIVLSSQEAECSTCGEKFAFTNLNDLTDGLEAFDVHVQRKHGEARNLTNR